HCRSTAVAKDDAALQVQVVPPSAEMPSEKFVKACRSMKSRKSVACVAPGETARSVSPPPGQASGFPVVLLLGTSLNVFPWSSLRQMKLVVVLKPYGALL